MFENFTQNIGLISNKIPVKTISALNNDTLIDIKIEHDRSLNKRLNIDGDKELVTFIELGLVIFEEYFEQSIPVEFRILFTWSDKQSKTFSQTLPRKTRLLWTPENIDIKEGLYWNSKTNIFYTNKKKDVKIDDYVFNQLKKHMLPTKLTGILKRVQRFLNWNIVYRYFDFNESICLHIYKALSGKNIKLNYKKYIFNSRFNPHEIPEYSIEEMDIEKIEFQDIQLIYSQ